LSLQECCITNENQDQLLAFCGVLFIFYLVARAHTIKCGEVRVSGVCTMAPAGTAFCGVLDYALNWKKAL